MKTHFLRTAILLSFCFILPDAQGSLFTTLHLFSVFPQGAQPEAALIQASDGNFYGTTTYGGTNGGIGTIYRMTPNGAISTLHTFTGGNDGAYPYCTLVQGTDGNLYGTCYGGGANGHGTVFKMTTSGVFTTLYSFTGGSDSANPAAGLIQASDGNFYGTASGSSDYSDYSDYGAIFRITPDGTFSTVYSFSDGDGANPNCALVQGTDGNLYGTCPDGGYLGFGTVFQVTTNGALTTLYTFTDGDDGASPEAALIQADDGNFYGTSSGYDDGGYYNYGAIFSITTNGTFITLYSFTGGSDGGDPYGPLVQGIDGTLYGTTDEGGSSGLGTIFNISTNGGALATVHSFSGGSDGANPTTGLIQTKDGTLFGTTAYGNTNDAGTLFTITSKGTYATLSGFSGILDGANPSANLAMGKDGNLYGTAEDGGATGNGVVFAATLSGAVTLLHSFGTVTDTVTGALLDGTFPKSKPVQGNDGCIYGTTISDGAYGFGTVFKVTTNGTFTVLHAFGAVLDSQGNSLDGGSPQAGLVQGQDGNFYGTCSDGGAYGYSGTVFQITTNGTFTTIYSFVGNNDGANPLCTLVQGTDGNLYGTCSGGGFDGDGTIFQMTTNGTCNTLYIFTGGSDSANPTAGLVQAADGNFYGTARGYDDGAVFRVTTNGDFTTLYSFTDGSDGAHPEAGLIQGPDGNLYGTTAYTNADEKGNGTVFQITTNGIFTTLWDFTGGNDGANPYGGLLPGNNGTFYGTAENGGAGGSGTLFQINLAPALQAPTITSGTITFNWNAVVGLEYQVQFMTNLAQPVWANLGTAFVATSQTNQVQDSIGPGRQRFYRTELLP